MSRGPGRVQRAVLAALQEAAGEARAQGEVPKHLTLREIVAAIGMDSESRSAVESVRRVLLRADLPDVEAEMVPRTISWAYYDDVFKRCRPGTSSRMVLAARLVVTHAERLQSATDDLLVFARAIETSKAGGTTWLPYYGEARRRLLALMCCGCVSCAQAQHLIAELDEKVGMNTANVVDITSLVQAGDDVSLAVLGNTEAVV